MKRTAFRICPACGNIITTTGDAEDVYKRQCRACEPRCPFGVPVAERMEKAAALFA